jgi:hypothetical protein
VHLSIYCLEELRHSADSVYPGAESLTGSAGRFAEDADATPMARANELLSCIQCHRRIIAGRMLN